MKDKETLASLSRGLMMTELSTTSLLPTETSPDYRDNETGCKIPRLTYVILDGVTVLICLFGLVGNGVVLWLLSFFIKRNPFTIYILNLAVADLSFLLSLLVCLILFTVRSLFCFYEFEQFLRFFLMMFVFAHNAGLYFLTAISVERCLSVFYPIWCRCHRPKHLSALVCALLWALSCLVTGVMSYFCYFVGTEHCPMSIIAMYALDFLIFGPIMVLSNLILFIKVRRSSQQRQPGRFYIVILLTVLFFLVFAVPFGIQRFGWYFKNVNIPIEISNALASVNSSINPLIYFLVGSYRKWRFRGSVKVALQRVFEEHADSREDREATRTDTMEMAN
ncbi:mas-related G-protein coupled receptor member H-like isoform X2 [Mauremys reevesii]|nr:mas-related G-protein coupled receptor member H-like isoform X2 [Mauremys reevesii]XP_039389708.1 mas-related G-protein coupled receptor member H-like isoform X2 [Mauremys reevesii]XP_039389709.1 mas-related G-protein coupled receptor member H-like isoform X2 [Mauremys reevesii]